MESGRPVLTISCRICSCVEHYICIFINFMHSRVSKSDIKKNSPRSKETCVPDNSNSEIKSWKAAAVKPFRGLEVALH